MFDWLLVSNITAAISIICGAPVLFLFFTEMNPAFAFRPSVFSPFVIKMCIILVGVCCVTIPLLFYAEGQRPYTITPEHSWNTTEIQNITSLSSDQSWSMNGGGNFFLGCGQVSINGGSHQEYVFYKITLNGYQLGTIDASNVFIKEDENKHPYIEWDYSHYSSPLKQWSDDNSIDHTLNGATSDTLVATYIHVPNGTIIKDYSLDGK